MWLYTQAYTYAKASVVAPVSYPGVVFAGLPGWLIWEHVPDAIALAGMCLVISAGLLSIYLSAASGKKTSLTPPKRQTQPSG